MKAGRVYYEIQAIGDASYPLNTRGHVIPQSQRLHFEQEVLPLPAAYFKRPSRMSFCFNHRLVPRDDYSTDGTIVLSGTPPFVLDLSIKNMASSEVHKETIETLQQEWRLDIPNYVFQTVGPHLVTIDSIRDASNCLHADSGMGRRSQWIDVAETAVIVPFDRREDFCVGEALQFQLEGSPPWNVKSVLNLTGRSCSHGPVLKVSFRWQAYLGPRSHLALQTSGRSCWCVLYSQHCS